MKYRFKTLEEFEKEFEKTSFGSFDIGKILFIPDMHHLSGVEIPNKAAKKILKANGAIFLDLGDLVPNEDNHWRFTKEMIMPVEEPGKFYPFAEEVEMLVWNDGCSKAEKRIVFGRKNGLYLAWGYTNKNTAIPFKNAKPLPEPVIVTMQEIADWKGVNVEQIKIEG